LGSSCTRLVPFCHLKRKRARNSADRKHHTGKRQPVPQQPPPQKHPGALLTCSFQSQTLYHHHFCCIRYQQAQNYYYACEKSHTRRSSSLPPQLTSNSCPMPKAAGTAPAKPRETPLTELLHNNLLSRTDPAHNCLTFSDLLSACCFAPLRICAARAIKSKQTAHAEILPKNKACLHQFQSPAHLFSCSPTLPLPFMDSLVALGRAVPRQAHTGTDQHYTQHQKQWGSRREKTLCKNNDSLTGDAVGQGDRQGRNGPERGGSTAASEKQENPMVPYKKLRSKWRQWMCKQPFFKT